MVNLFDVSRVVLAGSAFTAFGDAYRDALQAVLDESVFMRHVHSVQVQLAENPADAPAIGAAMVVLRNLLESPSEPPPAGLGPLPRPPAPRRHP